MISLERILFELKLIYKKIRVRKKYPNVINTIIDKRVSLSTSAVINGSILTGNVKIGENVLFNSVNIVGNVSIGDYSAIEGPTNILGSFEKN